MDRMEEGKNIFEDLGWDEEIENLEDPHIPFIASPERERNERSARDQFRDEYVMTPFSKCIQAWKLRAEEDQRRYADKFEIDAVKKNLTKCVGGDPNDVVDLSADILKKPEDVDVEDNSTDIEEVKVVGESSRTLSFRKKMRGLSPHRLPLKKRMID